MRYIHCGPIASLLFCPLFLAHYHWPRFVSTLGYILLRTTMYVQAGPHVLLGVVRFMQIAYLRLSLTIRLVNLLTRQRWLTDGIWTLLLTVSYSSTPEAQLMDSLITHRLLMFPYQDGRNKWLHNINLYARPAHGNTLSGVCST